MVQHGVSSPLSNPPDAFPGEQGEQGEGVVGLRALDGLVFGQADGRPSDGSRSATAVPSLTGSEEAIPPLANRQLAANINDWIQPRCTCVFHSVCACCPDSSGMLWYHGGAEPSNAHEQN